MAKKIGKNSKDKAKKKPVAKKPAAKKAAPKAAKKAAPKKAAPKKAAPAKPAPKKAAASAAKAPAKKAPAAPAKALKVKPQPASPKPAKPEGKAKGKSEPVEAPELEAAEVEEVADEEVVLTDAEGRRYCRVKDCDQLSAVDAYCRYHYLALWKKIQVRKKILSEGKLERYIEELTARYPDKFLDMLRKDLRSEKEFLGAIAELEIDESAVDNEFEDEAQNYIDEVRGIEPTTREEEDF